MGLKKLLKTGMSFLPGGNIVSGVMDMFENSGMSPEAKLELKKFKMENEQELAKIEAEGIAREMEASASVIMADSKSDDKWQRRWRPTFGYMVTLLLFWNYALVPVVAAEPVKLPESLFQLFGAYLLAAVGFRSWEKVARLKD